MKQCGIKRLLHKWENRIRPFSSDSGKGTVNNDL